MKPNLSLTSERIRKIIESKGLTLERFGDLIGDTPISSVNNWLRGVSLPNKNRLLTIANIGNTSADWIKWGTLEEYIASYLIDSGYELYIKDFPEIPHKVFNDIQERYSNTFSLNKDYELLNPIIKNIFTKYYSKDFEDYRDIEVKPDPKKVGRKIRSIRKKLGLTMQEFGCEVSNSPRSTVSTWEHGGNLPNKAKLRKIADIANCSVEDLLFDEGFIFKQSKVKLINELKEENSKLKEKIKYYECLFDGIESLLNSRKNS
ncbi:helix-turn-helix transcriptional regulator [Enterococcus lactis]|uniref:helix-turn-helix domain-containing protein n=1 Tax=Enterococcus lactis TaxID=357441 RepID=UPI0031CCFCFC